VTVRCLSAGLCRSAATVLGDFPNALAYPVDYEQQDHGAMGERAMNVPGMGKRLSCFSRPGKGLIATISSLSIAFVLREWCHITA
jgi:hypothetical protein